MPTTIPMTRHRARAAIYANKIWWAQIAAQGYQAWNELHKILRSEDFWAVATFSAIGLLVSLLALISGVQGVWM